MCKINYEKTTESQVVCKIVLFINFKVKFTVMLRYQYFHYIQYGDLSPVEFAGCRLLWKDQG